MRSCRRFILDNRSSNWGVRVVEGKLVQHHGRIEISIVRDKTGMHVSQLFLLGDRELQFFIWQTEHVDVFVDRTAAADASLSVATDTRAFIKDGSQTIAAERRRSTLRN